MKTAIAIFLSAAFMFHSFSKLALVVGYELNKEYIVKHLCENREKPKLHCNGKCHLAKELSKDEKRESAPSTSLKEIFELVLFTEEQVPAFNFSAETNIEHASAFYQKACSAYLLSIYHPPCKKA